MSGGQVSKPNAKASVPPLMPILVFDEPFGRIIIDCVGLLPQTWLGNQYLLAVMWASTQFSGAQKILKAPSFV